VTAPRWAVALLELLAPRGRGEDAVGDLHEMHGRHVARRGPVVGHLLTAFGALDMAVALVRQRSRGHDKGRRWDMSHSIENWRRDFAQAARSLGRARGFALVTVATLALAIGANTAIFSVVDSVLLDPLDYPEADRLVAIYASAPGSDLPEEFGPAPEFYIQYEEGSALLEDLAIGVPALFLYLSIRRLRRMDVP